MSRECLVLNKQQHVRYSHALDRLGQLSAEAQHLTCPITSWEKWTSDTIVLLLEDAIPTGFIRWGHRNLFLTPDPITTPLKFFKHIVCVLDFFVENQRRGNGTFLIHSILNSHDISSIAFDRPSEKLVWFLKSKFHVDDLIYQPNKFVISRRFFYIKFMRVSIPFIPR